MSTSNAPPPHRPPSMSSSMSSTSPRNYLSKQAVNRTFVKSQSLQSKMGSLVTKNGTKRLQLTKALKTYSDISSVADNDNDDDAALSTTAAAPGAQRRRSSSGFTTNVPKSPKTSNLRVASVVRKTNESMESLEVASFTHLLEWCESAERVKEQMRKEDTILIQNMNGCCRRCFQCFCPGFTCCNQCKPPRRGRGVFNVFSVDSHFVQHAEMTYTCCCCFRCPLTLFTALFIWWDMPMLLVKARVVLLLQVASQIATTVFQWMFLFGG
jgi:hypothetical protein